LVKAFSTKKKDFYPKKNKKYFDFFLDKGLRNK